MQITYGYNKERKRDLKQFKIGLAVTNDGFPILGEVLDGNPSDKTWNKKLLENIPEYFNMDDLKENILVANSAFVTKETLELAKDKCIFISRLPNTFSLASELTQEAYDKGDWLHLGQLASRKEAAAYKIQEFTKEFCGHQYRFIVVHSDHLDKRRLNSLNKSLEKQRIELEKEAAKLMRIEFACEPDAQSAFNSFLKTHHNSFYPITFSIEQSLEPVKRKKGWSSSQKGNPSIY